MILLATLLLIIFFSSSFGLGWHYITSGRTDNLIDGTTQDVGKIFYPIRKFFEKKTQEKRFYKLEGDTETIKRAKFYGIDLKYQDDFQSKHMWKINMEQFEGKKNTKEDFLSIEDKLRQVFKGRNIEFVFAVVGEIEFRVYEYYFKYQWPELLRDPLFACPTCMASIFGSIVYWHCYYFGVIEFEGIYEPIFWWVITLISTACWNTKLVAKK